MANNKAKIEIPPPPGAKASPEELAAYFENYGLDELEAAGYVQNLTAEEQSDVEALAARLRDNSR